MSANAQKFFGCRTDGARNDKYATVFADEQN